MLWKLKKRRKQKGRNLQVSQTVDETKNWRSTP